MPPPPLNSLNAGAVLDQLQADAGKDKKVSNSTCSTFCPQHKTCLWGGGAGF